MSTEWKPAQGKEGVYEGRDRKTGAPTWTATRVDLIFGSHSVLEGACRGLCDRQLEGEVRQGLREGLGEGDESRPLRSRRPRRACPDGGGVRRRRRRLFAQAGRAGAVPRGLFCVSARARQTTFELTCPAGFRFRGHGKKRDALLPRKRDSGLRTAPACGIHPEISSSARLVVRGPKMPIVAITTPIAAAMKTKTPNAPEAFRMKAMMKDEKITESRLHE